MKKKINILMIGTNGIDCFVGLAQAFREYDVEIMQAKSMETAKTYLVEKSFTAILINLEPDGEGGVHGIDILPSILESENNQDAVCFSISAVNATALLSADPEYLNILSIIVGWLSLPIINEKAAKTILDIIQAPKQLVIKHRLPKQHVIHNCIEPGS